MTDLDNFGSFIANITDVVQWKPNSTQHVITFLIEDWREKLDQKFLVGAVLTDVPKTFNCIPHDLLITKLATFGFDLNALTLICTYLKKRKQSVKQHINSTYNSFENILLGVPERSIVVPIDDNTLFTFSKTIEGLLHILPLESVKAIKWFRENKIIINAEKFQVLLIDKKKQDHANEVVQIEE